MKRLLAGLGAVALSLAFAAPAQAIDGGDCFNTLRGTVGHVGYHGYDNDIYRAWQWYEGAYGINIVSSWPYDWWRVDGTSHHVGAKWAFQRANGQLILHAFSCWDGRPFGAAYVDESWFRIA